MYWHKKTLKIEFDPEEGRIILSTIFRGETIGIWRLKDFILWRDVHQFLQDIYEFLEGAIVEEEYNSLSAGSFYSKEGNLYKIDEKLWEKMFKSE